MATLHSVYGWSIYLLGAVWSSVKPASAPRRQAREKSIASKNDSPRAFFHPSRNSAQTPESPVPGRLILIIKSNDNDRNVINSLWQRGTTRLKHLPFIWRKEGRKKESLNSFKNTPGYILVSIIQVTDNNKVENYNTHQPMPRDRRYYIRHAGPSR